MEIYLLIILCTLSFAIISGLGSLIWQITMSRDKSINQKAQLNALDKEIDALESIRGQVNSNARYNAHYQLLMDNQNATEVVEQKINSIMAQKAMKIRSYSKLVRETSSDIIQNDLTSCQTEQIELCRDMLSETFEQFNHELELLQEQRSRLWINGQTLQKSLLEEEISKNQSLDKLYDRHTNLLEKIYLGHNEQSHQIQLASLDASKEVFAKSVTAPTQLASSLWQKNMPSNEAISQHALHEFNSRVAVRNAGVSANASEWTEVTQSSSTENTTDYSWLA